MDNLTDEQKIFLESEGLVLVKACPGSGKTFTVANKLLNYISNWDKHHQGVAVLSFTNVASDEIYQKANSIHNCLGKLGYPHFIGTVDSFIDEYIVMRYGHLYTHDRARPQIVLTDTLKLPYKYWRSECYKNRCVDNIENFHYDKDKNFYNGKNLVVCELRGGARDLPCQQYKRMLAKKNIVFQNETAYFAYNLLKKYPVIASAITERFPIIIIDEAQDTSEEQMLVFDMLAENGVQSMFLVGDSDQAIYEWRNANPECFLKKLSDEKWKNIELTGNFRSSQKICNATSFFSDSLKGNKFNQAIGKWKDENEKPVLLLTKKNTEDQIISHFIDKCNQMNIEVSPQNVAVLTRGRIHSDTDVRGLWKSKEIETFAKASYEWRYGSRKTACKYVSRASFIMIFGEDLEEYQMIQKIKEYTDEETWKDFIIDILSVMPDVELGIAEWVKTFLNSYENVVARYGFKIHEKKNIKECFKIKTRDQNIPHFKEIPLKRYFERKIQGEYTRSSIHGVKGETYDAVLLYIKSTQGNTITPKFLVEGDLSDELMRIAYVAMTRPKRLLMIAMPESKVLKGCKRFSRDYWNYEYIETKERENN